MAAASGAEKGSRNILGKSGWGREKSQGGKAGPSGKAAAGRNRIPG